MKRFIKILLSCLLFFGLLVGGSLYAVLSTQQSDHHQFIIDAQAAARSKAVLKRAVRSLKQQQDTARLAFTQQELNGLSALAHRAFPKFTSQITLAKSASTFSVSVKFSIGDFSRFLNVFGYVLPSNKGLVLGDVTVGSITISGDYVIKLLALGIDYFVQDNLGSEVVNLTKKVVMNERHIIFTVEMPSHLMTNNQDGRSRLLQLRDELALFGDVEVIRLYYQTIVSISAYQSSQNNLTTYIRELFSLAKIRSQNGFGDAVVENKAALTALVLYLGSDRFELLVGDVAKLTEEQSTTRYNQRANLTLANRVDLQKHFVYSIALQLFGSTGTSDALGEAKEFLDSNTGGTGFSFADLLADRAGTRIAQLATESIENAQYVQNELATIENEGDIFPTIDGLPEGVSAKTFEQKYKSAESSDYKKMLAFIDARLRELRVYQPL